MEIDLMAVQGGEAQKGIDVGLSMDLVSTFHMAAINKKTGIIGG